MAAATPAPIKVQYVLGPCDGRHATIDASVLRGGSVSCGGAVYYVRANTGNPVFLDFAPNVEAGAVANAKFDPSAVFVSFHALMRTLGYTVPTLMTEARGSLARIRKAVR